MVIRQATLNDSVLRQGAEHFRHDGICVFRSLISRRQVKRLLKNYEEMVIRTEQERIRRNGDDGKPHLIYIDNPTRIYAHWKKYEYFRKASLIAEALLARAVRHHEDQIIVKPPRCPQESPWHQDSAYWKRLGIETSEGVVCWLALSPSSSQSGGLQFILGSHKHGILEHRDVARKWELPEALETQIGDTQPLRLVLEPGDATFHHYRTLHYSAGNSTNYPRQALTTHFWDASVSPLP